MCHLSGGSMKGSMVTQLKGGTPGGSSLATLSHQGQIQGVHPQGVCGAWWGPRGQWSPAVPSWLSWAFPEWQQGMSRRAGPAGRWHRQAGRERPGSAVAGAPRPIRK